MNSAYHVKASRDIVAFCVFIVEDSLKHVAKTNNNRGRYNVSDDPSDEFRSPWHLKTPIKLENLEKVQKKINFLCCNFCS